MSNNEEEEHHDSDKGTWNGYQSGRNLQGDVNGYTYVGYGWCKDCEDVRLSRVYTYNGVNSAEECATICEPFKVESSYRGFTWVDGEGRSSYNCYCMIDSGSDLSSLQSKYGGDGIEVNPGSGPIGFANSKYIAGQDVYCYALDTQDACQRNSDILETPSPTPPTSGKPTADDEINGDGTWSSSSLAYMHWKPKSGIKMCKSAKSSSKSSKSSKSKSSKSKGKSGKVSGKSSKGSSWGSYYTSNSLWRDTLLNESSVQQKAYCGTVAILIMTCWMICECEVV